MMPANNNPFAGIHKVFFALLLIGFITALGLINSDLVNPITSLVKAGRYVQETDQIKNNAQIQQNAEINAQATLQSQKNIIDQKTYAKEKAAEAQAQIAIGTINVKLKQQELQAQKQKLEIQSAQAALELEMSRLFNYGKIGIGFLVAICFGIVLIQFGYSRLILAQAQTKRIERTDSWQNPVWRKNQIKLARQCERMTRIAHIQQSQTAAMSAIYPDEAPISWEEVRRQFTEAEKLRKANKSRSLSSEIEKQSRV